MKNKEKNKEVICVGCYKPHIKKLMTFPWCSNKCWEKNPVILNLEDYAK